MSDKTASRRAPAQQSLLMRDRRHKPQQMDLFGSGQPRAVEGAPTWPELPPETQRALIRLMARLLLEHAEKCQAALPMGAGHDL